MTAYKAKGSNLKVGIINYGSGNITSVQNAIKYYENIDVSIVSEADEMRLYDKLILPGVGAFKPAIDKMKEKSLDKGLEEYIKSGNYLLGICLGMQLLASKSFEHGEHNGLGFIEGEIKSFSDLDLDIRVPHMGWNSIDYKEHKLFASIENKSDFYFVHSYYFNPKEEKNILAYTKYGVEFASMVQNDNVLGAQFHPEKSQESGLTILKNFLEL